ncbi:MAG: flagellar hook-associated protein FlgK [Rhodobacteraceae bacterium]|nr:flagellar hook-associated protein FlgK [Paracoccaceae bacterium]MAY46931.1 flagellar hook-associated protein FlgK [Paracoccaceae bacterium]QEW22939.1 Flagellar hook-associated protein 1 [Marinibacterium anthonyi]
MSLSAASRNAISGLTMASLTTRLISDNIANALTPGYGVRTLGLTSDHDGNGVRVLGITRFTDPVLLANRREADAAYGKNSIAATFLSRVEGIVGLPDDAFSLSARVTQFQTELLEATSRPDSGIRLDQAVQSAADLATAINKAARDVQTLRNEAEIDITQQVDRLNELLVQVDELNVQISKTAIAGKSTAPLVDRRQVLIDELSAIVPVREVRRDDGQVSLYSTGGAILLDTQPAEIGFTRVNLVSEFSSIDTGTLYGLTFNGRDIATDPDSSNLRGGTLIAAFEVRDVTAVEMQNRLDGMARDLVERFEDASVDATRGAGDPGLFTDNGNALDPLDVLGLAQRLELNAAIDPDQGGETWRLRDGLGAATQGSVGDASLIIDLMDAMESYRTAPTAIGTGSYSATGLADYISSLVSTEATSAEADQSYAAIQQSEMISLEDADGVDSDAELQSLMIIEQLYAANAQVLQTIDLMMQTLLEI